MVFALLACAGSPGLSDTAGAAADTADAVNPYGEAESLGCPAFEEGKNTLAVGDLERTVHLRLPAEPEGAPVVFAWHWLNGTPSQTLSWMGLEDMTDDGAIVVAPTSTGIPSVEWDVVTTPEKSIDIALFDTLLSCLWEQYAVDTERVHATGMSAGGLFTSFLSMHRADVLASTVPFSGGVSGAYYSAPSWAMPMMLVWGGPTDTYGGYDFHEATLAMSQSLRDDGHFVVECMHTDGHNPPDEAKDMAWAFFDAHPASADAPWASGLPDSLPAWCEVP